MYKNKSILITGGTGSFGKNFVNYLLKKNLFNRIVIFSRDELKQFDMSSIYPINKYKLSDVYKSKFVVISDVKTKRLKEFDSFEALNKKHFQIYNKFIKIRSDILSDVEKFYKTNLKKKKGFRCSFQGNRYENSRASSLSSNNKTNYLFN